MPRTGGESDKLGNRYEGIWTAGELLRLAAGEFAAVTVEPLGDDGTGIEFVTRSHDGRRTFHSAKRQRSGGEWSLSALTDTGPSRRSILSDLLGKLESDPRAECVFVSSTGARELRELRERARRRRDVDEFRRDLDESVVLRDKFVKYFVNAAGGWDESFEFLRRLQVTLIDEERLMLHVDQQISLLVYRPDGRPYSPKDVRLTLADFVLDRLGGEITRDEVWFHLRSEGFAYRDWSSDPSVRDRLDRHADGYVCGVRADLINGEWIDRSEAGELFSRVTAPDGPRTVLASAAAGFGKSTVLAEVVDRLRAAGTPLAVIRLDAHPDAVSTIDLGRPAGLTVSPVVALAGVSAGGPSVLVIDQLDAVSSVSGRNPRGWELFDAVCREAASYPNMRVVAACRDFDIENDHRLRRLAREDSSWKRLGIGELSDEEVEASIARAGRSSAGLTEGQRTLLRVPLHLFLFLGGEAEDAGGFTTVGDLFDRFWRAKARAVRERTGNGSAWVAAIDRICDEMSRRQALSVPAVVADDLAAAGALRSEHVLIEEAGRLRFFHESFFDYAFARRFVASGRSVTDLLGDGEQHLFRRSQVRQVLAFLRDHDRQRYLGEVRSLLKSDHARFHIKRLVFQGMRSLPDPTESEWHILEPHLDDDTLRGHVLSIVRDRIPWFDVLHGTGVIGRWMAGPDDLVERGLRLLWSPEVRKQRSAAVARLLSPYRGRSPEWMGRLRGMLGWGGVHHSPEMRELFLGLAADGVFDGEDAGPPARSFWNVLLTSAEEAPEFALDAMTEWLDRRIETAASETWTADETPKVFDRDEFDRTGPAVVMKVAEKVPARFAAEILPRVQRIIELTEVPWKDGPKLDATWGRLSASSVVRLSDAVLEGLISALGRIAVENPREFRTLVGGLTATPWQTVAYVLLRAWSAAPAEFADDALGFLAERPERLEIGYSSWSGGGNPTHAVSRNAIRAFVPHATFPYGERLEEVVLGIACDGDPPSELFRQRLLLEAFDGRLSAAGLQRLRTLRDLFPGEDLRAPSRGEPPSPREGRITAESAEAFSDEDWLRLMQLKDDTSPGDLTGRTWDLTRSLEAAARKDRRRFADLSGRMGDDVPASYFAAILDGICSRTDVPADERRGDAYEFRRIEIEHVLGVIRRIHLLPARPCGRSICHAFERLADRQVPAEDLRILEYYAVQDPDPEDDKWLELDRHEAGGGRSALSRGRVYGLNTVRGAAAEAIGALLFADESRAGILVPIIEAMADDPSLGVRACVFRATLPLLNGDRDQAVELFLRACRAAEPVFDSDGFGDFVRYASGTHYSRLRPILLAALASGREPVEAAAAIQVCLAGFADEQAERDADDVRAGSAVKRRAAAEVYARNLSDPAVQEACAMHLPRFFMDDEEAVRAEASAAFLGLDDADLGRLTGLIRSYIESPAFPTPHDGLLRRLNESTWQLPDVTLRLAERFVEACGVEAGDIATAAAGDAPTVVKLVVRLYTQTEDAAVRVGCLDLIDAMERLGFFGIEEELARNDR